MFCSTRIYDPKNLEHGVYAVSRFDGGRLLGTVPANKSGEDDRQACEEDDEPRIWKDFDCDCLKTDGIIVAVVI